MNKPVRTEVNATLTRYSKLLGVALEKLDAEQPGWTPSRHMRIARTMVDAFLSGYLRQVAE